METPGETTWFRSKVDLWVALLLPAVPVLLVAFAFVGPDDPPGVRWFGIAGAGLVLAIYGLFIYPMRYGIGREHLIVRAGLLRWRFPLAAIREVRPTRCPLSSPALSLDRLLVIAGPRLRDRTMISAEGREPFLALLAERAGLRREGDLLRVLTPFEGGEAGPG